VKRVQTFLKIEGFNHVPNELQPDGKVHRFPSNETDSQNAAWCIVYQNFGSKTGEEFFTVVYGDFIRAISNKNFCTLEGAKGDDRTALNKRLKNADKQVEKLKQQFISEISGDIAEMTGVPEEEVDRTPAGFWIKALGFKEGEYFFTSSHNGQIVKLSSFSDTELLKLIPLEYWEAMFPGQANAKVDWTIAKSTLMQQAREKGIFQERLTRGAGVWLDEGRTVVNMGDHLIVGGKALDLGSFRSKYFYTLGVKLSELHKDPLTVEECSTVIEACETFRWKKTDYGFLLAGALVTSRICGALPIRPHVWLLGEKGAGKSTLFNRLIEPLLGENALFIAGSSTEAGIRQSVSANAVPVIFDEFENNGQKSADTVRSVLDLMRVSWSETNAVILKGGAGGASQGYQARFAAIVTSIRQVSMTDADRSRFATIELDNHGNDPKHWQKLDGLLNEIDVEFGNRLFARTIKMLPILMLNFKMMKKTLSKQVTGQRFADQYGMLLAGYAILMQDEAINQAQADIIASHVTLEEIREEEKITDQDSCLDHLLTKKIAVETMDSHGTGTIKVEMAMSEAILQARSNALVQESLGWYGIKTDLDCFAIRCNHIELENLVFKGTRWSNSWAKTLIRIPGSTRKKARIAGIVKNVVMIPMTIFD